MNSPTDEGATQEVLEAERSLYRLMLAKDVAGLDKILAPNLIYIHSQGIAESKEEYLRNVSRSFFDYEKIESRDVRVAVHGDVAIMHGILDMFAHHADNPKRWIHLLFVLVWRKEPAGWQLEYRQCTRIPPDKPW